MEDVCVGAGAGAGAGAGVGGIATANMRCKGVYGWRSTAQEWGSVGLDGAVRNLNGQGVDGGWCLHPVYAKGTPIGWEHDNLVHYIVVARYLGELA